MHTETDETSDSQVVPVVSNSSERFKNFLTELKERQAAKRNLELSLTEDPPKSYEEMVKRLSQPKSSLDIFDSLSSLKQKAAMPEITTLTPEDVRELNQTADRGTVGQAGVDSYIKVPGVPEFELGEKREAEGLGKELGGNAANAASAMELILKGEKNRGNVSLDAPLGTDENTSFIIESLQEKGIGLHTKQDRGTNAASTIMLFPGNNRVILSEKAKREEKYRFSYEGKTPDSLYLTTIGYPWKDAYDDVVTYAKTHPEVALAVSPGTAQFSGIEKEEDEQKRDAMKKTLYEAIAVSNALFVNKEEAIRLLKDAGKDAPDDIESLLMAMKELGPKIVSITDGEKGSYAINSSDAIFYNKPFPLETPVSDTTGAGDSYASTFFTYLRLTGDIKRSMECAAINASSVVQKRGAQAGLMTGKEIETKRLQNLDYRAQMIKEPNPDKDIPRPKKREFYALQRKNKSLDEHLRSREQEIAVERETVLV